MITHHVHHAPFTAAAITARTPYVRGHEIRWRQGPGKYANGMAEYLDLMDGEDEWTGTTEWDVHVRRFGKRLLCTDERGFVWVTRYDTEDDAIAEFSTLDAEYCAWDAQEEEEEDTAPDDNVRAVPDTGSYLPFAIADDGEALCATCVRDPSNPIHSDAPDDGWRIVDWSHSGDTDETVTCAHCGRVIHEEEGT
jgi:hypothetical protein